MGLPLHIILYNILGGSFVLCVPFLLELKSYIFVICLLTSCLLLQVSIKLVDVFNSSEENFFKYVSEPNQVLVFEMTKII